MDNISGLPDDLLVKILSFLPTDVAVSTCVLSKRWEFLWMWLPNLDFISTCVPRPGLTDFIDRKLPIHRAPVIERLRLHLTWLSHTKPEDINRWIQIAISRNVSELIIDYYSKNENLFPSSLFTCKSLVTLKLKWVALIDVPSMVYLPSLKTLELETMSVVDGKSLQQLLSNCPVLEVLSVNFSYNGNLREFTIIIPSLKSLSLFLRSNYNLNRYEIDTPSLKYLKLVDPSHLEHYSLIKNMPKVKEAYVSVGYNLKTLNSAIRSVTYVKRLTICSMDVYGDGFVFSQLEHLNLCVCKTYSWNLLGQLLKDSPTLRVLNISVVKDHIFDKRYGMVSWNQPSPVPECLLSSLQIFNWSGYLGSPEERDIAVYILRNACHLKTATILSQPCLFPTHYMLKELESSPRASTTCQLVFH